MMLWGPSCYITREPRAGPPSSPPAREPNPVRLGNIPHGIFPGWKTPLAVPRENQKKKEGKKARKESKEGEKEGGKKTVPATRPGMPLLCSHTHPCPCPSPQAVGSVVGAGQPL
jgi:hypothetical protein